MLCCGQEQYAKLLALESILFYDLLTLNCNKATSNKIADPPPPEIQGHMIEYITLIWKYSKTILIRSTMGPTFNGPFREVVGLGS